jgi:hypothetical protein
VLLRPSELAERIRLAPVFRGPFEAMDRVMRLLESRTSDVRGRSSVRLATDWPLVFARNAEELNGILSLLIARDYVRIAPSERGRTPVELTLGGWARIEELRRTGVKPDQAFLAMWFHASMDDARDNGFLPAIRDAGYEPMVLSLLEHNRVLDDVIVSEIRRSGLVVADFTGDRKSVYFEAGFAFGLGIEVIYTCRADALEAMAFDTEHRNHVVWVSAADLRPKLAARIRATSPRPRSHAADR